MAKKRKWGPVLAFGAATAILGGIAAYQHRKAIERTLQEIADQMDAWDGSEDFFHDQDAVVHTVDAAQPAKTSDEAEQAEAVEESDFADASDSGEAQDQPEEPQEQKDQEAGPAAQETETPAQEA